jgi:hypothetical protein
VWEEKESKACMYTVREWLLRMGKRSGKEVCCIYSQSSSSVPPIPLLCSIHSSLVASLRDLSRHSALQAPRQLGVAVSDLYLLLTHCHCRHRQFSGLYRRPQRSYDGESMHSRRHGARCLPIIVRHSALCQQTCTVTSLYTYKHSKHTRA